jgi:hypothetical protein
MARIAQVRRHEVFAVINRSPVESSPRDRHDEVAMPFERNVSHVLTDLSLVAARGPGNDLSAKKRG